MNSAAEQDFINDIRENPHDDRPRLIYADWLEDREDAQGTLMRLQVELANDPYRENGEEVQQKVNEILREHEYAMRNKYVDLMEIEGPIKKLLLNAQITSFRRGMLGHVTGLNTSHLSAVALESGCHKVLWESIRIRFVRGGRVQACMKLLQENFSNIRELDLRNTGITDAGLEHLTGMKEMRELHLWGTDVTDAGVEHLANKLGKTLNDDADPNTLRANW